MRPRWVVWQEATRLSKRPCLFPGTIRLVVVMAAAETCVILEQVGALEAAAVGWVWESHCVRSETISS